MLLLPMPRVEATHAAKGMLDYLFVCMCMMHVRDLTLLSELYSQRSQLGPCNARFLQIAQALLHLLKGNQHPCSTCGRVSTAAAPRKLVCPATARRDWPTSSTARPQDPPRPPMPRAGQTSTTAGAAHRPKHDPMVAAAQRGTASTALRGRQASSLCCLQGGPVATQAVALGSSTALSGGSSSCWG